MKILSVIVSVLWMCLRHSPTALYYLPTVLPVILKFREAFGSDKVQEAFKALGEFVSKIAPPAPTADSTGTIPANTERERRWRFTRFMNRTRLAGDITDNEVRNICAAHLIKPYESEVA